MQYGVRFVSAAAITLTLAFASVQGASASMVDVTFTGTVTDGIDSLGLFSNAGTDLTNASFSAQYVFDSTINAGPFNSTGVVGGTSQSTSPPSPLISATLTINGSTLSVPRGDFDQLIAESFPGFFLVSAQASASNRCRW